MTITLVIALTWFAGASVWLAVTDAKTKLLPNCIVWPTTIGLVLLLGIDALVDDKSDSLYRAMLSAFANFAIYFLLGVAGKNTLGFGDVKLSLSIGFLLGYFNWFKLTQALFLAFALAAVTALILLALKRTSLKSTLPFGPFMLAGAWLAICL